MDNEDDRLLDEYNKNQDRIAAYNEKRLEALVRMGTHLGLGFMAFCAFGLLLVALTTADLQWCMDLRLNRGVFTMAGPTAFLAAAYMIGALNQGHPRRAYVAIGMILLMTFVMGVTWSRF